MQLTCRVTKVLHDEHISVISLMEKLQNFASGAKPTSDDASAANRFLSDIIAAIEGEITGHFDFEENDLFPLVNEEGAEDMSALLGEEHSVIKPLGDALTANARAAIAGGFDDASWTDFKRLGGEYAERLTSHAQKEEMSLLPLLDEIIEDDLDRQLDAQYRGA